ncbi:MAG: hypothetical protein ACOC3V_01050 [bacterium]
MNKLYEVYTLKKSFIPTIKKGKIIKGEEYGGVLLIYKKRLIMFKELYLLGIRIKIPIKKHKANYVAFIKPFKKYWNVKKDFLPPNYWNGKKSKKPLTNIWCKLNRSDFNYKNFNIAISSNIYYEKKYLNQKIKKTLDSKSKKIITEPFKF